MDKKIDSAKDDVILTREAPLGEVGIITTDEKVFWDKG